MSSLLKTRELASALGVNPGIIAMAKKAGHIFHNADGYYDILNPKNKHWISGQVAKGKTFDIAIPINNRFTKTTGRPKKTDKQIEKITKKFEKIDTPNIELVNEDVIEPIVPIEQSDDLFIIDQKIPIKQAPEKKQREAKNNTETKTKPETDADDLYAVKLKFEIKKLKNNDRLETLKIAKIEGELLPVNSVENIFLWAAENFRKTYEQDVDNMINIFIKRLGGEQKDFIELKKMAMESLSITGNSLKENLLEGLDNAISEYSEVRARGERR